MAFSFKMTTALGAHRSKGRFLFQQLVSRLPPPNPPSFRLPPIAIQNQQHSEIAFPPASSLVYNRDNSNHDLLALMKNPMIRLLQPFCLAILAIVALALHADSVQGEDGDAKKLRALIIDGQNNHAAWPQTTIMAKKYLEDSGRFTVEIARTKYTWKGGKLLEEYPLNDGTQYEDLPEPKSDPDFRPTFSDYDVVISNFGWKAAPWPQETQTALEKYVSSGGGFVVIHAADNSFGSWNEFNKMIGLGGWDGRNETSGPYVYVNKDGKVIRDTSPGRGGSHGPAHEYQVVVRSPDHPIVKGLPRSWMHTKDELYQQLRGPALNMTILATAYAHPDKRGSDRHEPKLMTIDYDKGRIFHTTMGHDAGAFSCVAFITTLVRGCEWSATGNVTLTSVPDDFPTSTQSSAREWKH